MLSGTKKARFLTNLTQTRFSMNEKSFAKVFQTKKSLELEYCHWMIGGSFKAHPTYVILKKACMVTLELVGYCLAFVDLLESLLSIILVLYPFSKHLQVIAVTFDEKKNYFSRIISMPHPPPFHWECLFIYPCPLLICILVLTRSNGWKSNVEVAPQNDPQTIAVFKFCMLKYNVR